MARLLSIAVASFCLAYYGLLRSGLGDVSKLTEPLYALPLLVASFLFLLATASDQFLSFKKRGVPGLVWLLGVTLLCAGYWVGSFVNYDASVVITEGQSIDGDYLKEAALVKYSGKYARDPDLSVTLLELRPDFSDEGTKLEGLDASFTIQAGGKGKKSFEISGSGSHEINGLELSISDFGYSPRYELYDKSGKVVDSSFVYLNLFPPDTEDYYRLLSPLTYYVRYYPKGTEGNPSPRFLVRVARNKDLVFSGEVGQGEKFRFENAAMSFPEVRRWTELRLRRNPGMPLLYAGAAVMAIAAVLLLRRRGAVSGQ